MRRIVALLTLLGLFLLSQPARAQGSPALSSLEVWIWPEYDQPSALVIQRIQVAPTTSLPIKMTFRIPAAAEKPHALAVGQTFATVADAPHNLEPDGKWIKVSLQVTAPAIQLEYYDPSLVKEGKNRSYTYEWAGDYAVESLHVELQQPFDASAVRTDPSLPGVATVPDGLTYYTGDFGALAAGQTFALDIRYRKDSDALTISFMKIGPSAPLDENTAGRISLETYLPWLLAAFGALMVAGGLFYYFRGTAAPRPSRRRHASSNETAAGQVYCSQCGTRARSGDRFCRACGARLRVETEE